MAPTSGHIVLLGDSIFDNKAYTRGEPDVISHLRDLVPSGWRATLAALDGATALDVLQQLSRLPSDATHLVLSAGGNDALMNSDLLDTPVSSSADTLRLFEERLGAFESAYRTVLEAMRIESATITVCTIYDGAVDGEMARLARVALMMFNDVIMRVAFERQTSVIELRTVCTDPADYANPIEPSGTGGRKIADAIARAVGARSGRVASQVFTGASGMK
jgi:hypothetical protein